jgi:hypothetical protein
LKGLPLSVASARRRSMNAVDAGFSAARRAVSGIEH